MFWSKFFLGSSVSIQIVINLSTHKNDTIVSFFQLCKFLGFKLFLGFTENIYCIYFDKMAYASDFTNIVTQIRYKFLEWNGKLAQKGT